MSGSSSAPVESMTRGLSIDRPGTFAGCEPVAMIACSKVSVSFAPPAFAIVDSVVASTNVAVPWT